MTPLVAYVLLFLAVGIGFIFVHLVLGKLIRPSTPSAEKGTIYECGEPTIGSAWVQFDLRYYVVALLFVVFDVEVAFFFPWAEVFGKANAVVSAPTPTNAEQYNDYAKKVLELGPPPPGGRVGTAGGKSPELERELWEKLASLSQAELDAHRMVAGTASTAGPGERKPTLHDVIFSDRRKQLALLGSLTEEQVATSKKQADLIAPMFDRLAREQDERVKALVAALEKLPKAEKTVLSKLLSKAMRNQTTIERFSTSYFPTRGLVTKNALETMTLWELQNLRVDQIHPLGEQPRYVRDGFEKAVPDPMQQLNDLTSRQQKELSKAATATLDALAGQSPEARKRWGEVLPGWLIPIGELTSDQRNALKDLTPAGVAALETRTVPGNSEPTNKLVEQTRGQASTIAWLAFGEILVFFGVLLVGFAYLWRRGDLAWVRSTAAEEDAPRTPSTPPVAPVPPRRMELEPTGKHS